MKKKPRDPFTQPFCRAEDLGLAIPDSDHAVSVCLPLWRDVIGYEEQEDRVHEALECGYPRFVPHPFVAELFLAAQQEFARPDESVLVFPSLAAAWRCADFAKKQGARSARIESYGWNQLTALIVREEDYHLAWKGWQHMGEIVSSRLAEAALTDAPLPAAWEEKGAAARGVIRERLASHHGEFTSPADVFLFSSGMAAIAAIHRVLMRRAPKLPTLQLEFPYLDSLKIQEKLNPAGAIDLSVVTDGGLRQVEESLAASSLAGLFTEVPSNPLLRTGNLAAIRDLLAKKQVPLVIDDTIATSVNVASLTVADAVTTSLTKAFSGAGDVAAGAVILNRKSPFHAFLAAELPAEESAGPLFCLDAMVLEINSRHYEERVRAMTANAAELVAALRDHPRVETIWHPSLVARENYEAIMKPGGGHGALFSMKLRGGEAEGAAFFDRLRVSKGPSLGTNFTLACPYTLLAHYDELDWAAQRGVPRDLIRVWTGLEEPEDLVERFLAALE